MNIVDLHPEDLIDKLEGGSLTAEEKSRLDSHLRVCAECRFEISARSDFADEALAPRPQAAGPLAEPAAPRATAARRSLPPRRALFIPALAAALVAGGALAAVVSEVIGAHTNQPSLQRLEVARHGDGRQAAPGRRARRADSPAEPTTEEVRAVTRAEGAPSGGGSRPPETDEGAASGGGSRLPETDEGAPSGGGSGREARRGGSRLPGNHSEPRGAKAPPEQNTAPTAAGGGSRPSETNAASLFGAANRARRYGDTSQAVALYRALQVRFPASEEARLSRATLAELELDRGDPAAALDGFERYLEQGGSALDAEALVGRAVALQKLGKSDEELASWREVARRFPGTAHAKRAAARIAVLSAR